MITIGSLFSGIGGLELGLEWAGLGPVHWQVESNEFCRRVLAKHWPRAERFDDVRAVRASGLRPVDLICGGFPCQDVSAAGSKEGLQGKRSGLWWEFARIISEARPRFVVVENVASGATRWLCTVRSHLHQLGYRTRALGVAASDVGASHARKRIFVVADFAGLPSRRAARSARPKAAANADRHREHVVAVDEEVASASSAASWAGGTFAEPDLVRMVHGVPRGMAGHRALGNAVVPQCAQVVGLVVQQLAEGAAR